jgi:phosphoserine phosphatase
MVVIWDIDGTIVSGSLEERFLRYLIRTKRLSWPRMASNLARLSIRWPPPKWYQLKLAYLEGRTVEEVDSWVKSCWELSLGPDLFTGAVEGIRRLKEQRIHQCLLSGTPLPLANVLADFLGIEDVVAAEPEIRHGRFTGGLKAPHPRGPRKIDYADSLLRKHGYDREQATILADHWDDRFLLKRAGHPIAVRPDRRLRKFARRRRWCVVDDVDDASSFLSAIQVLPHTT